MLGDSSIKVLTTFLLRASILFPPNNCFTRMYKHAILIVVRIATNDVKSIPTSLQKSNDSFI